MTELLILHKDYSESLAGAGATSSVTGWGNRRGKYRHGWRHGLRVDFLCSHQIEYDLARDITPMVGGAAGLATGKNATTHTPAIRNLYRMLEAAHAYLMQLGFLARAIARRPSAVRTGSGVVSMTDCFPCGARVSDLFQSHLIPARLLSSLATRPSGFPVC